MAIDQQIQLMSGFPRSAAHLPMVLTIPQSSGNAVLPVTKYCCEPLAGIRVKRRHFLRKIEQRTAAAHSLGLN